MEWTEVEIPLGEGPDEKTARLLRAPGVLRAPLNVDNRTSGMLRKRRGHTLVDLDAVVNVAEDSEDVFHALGLLRGELVVIGHDYLYAVVSLGGNVTGLHASGTINRRGPVIRGGYAIEHVVSSSMGTEI